MTLPATTEKDLPQGNARSVATILGEIEVQPEHVINFERGMLGFDKCHDWIILESDRPNTAWLQSVDVPHLAFLLLDPFAAFPEFSVDVPVDIRLSLSVTAADDIAVLAPVTLYKEENARGQNSRATANLRGLVFINWRERVGVQGVIDGGPWSVKQEVPLEVIS